MHDDGAVLPKITADSALQTLALVLLDHTKSPESAGAWLNLGLSLRQMALYRTQDSEPVKRRRLCDALEAFERSLQLDSDNVGKNIRAWTGLTGSQLRRLLSIPSRNELDAFLKKRGVWLEYTVEDFRREGETTASLLAERGENGYQRQRSR